MNDIQHSQLSTVNSPLKPGYKQTEVGVIPVDWELIPFLSLGSVIDGDRGTNYPGSMDFSSDGHCLFLNAGNVTKAGFRFGECAFISREKDERLSKGKLKRDDIVLTTRGTVGNFAHFDSVVSFEHIRINSGMVILRNESAALDTSYLYTLFQSHFVEKQIERLTFGSAQPQLTVKGINEFAIVVPPLPEQRAIATALSNVDALLSGLDRLITKKRDLKQAAMQQLLTGSTRLPGFHGEWEVKRLGDVADIDSDNLGSDTTSDFAFNYISLEDVDIGTLRSYSEQVFSSAPSRARRRLKAGDILISTVRPNLQSHLLFTSMQPNWVCSTGFSVVRCKIQDAVSGYIFSHIFANGVTKQIEALLTGSNYPAINGGDVRKLEIPLPPLPEQTAIAAVLSDMDADLAALELRRDKTRALKQAMMQVLLTGKIRLTAS